MNQRSLHVPGRTGRARLRIAALVAVGCLAATSCTGNDEKAAPTTTSGKSTSVTDGGKTPPPKNTSVPSPEDSLIDFGNGVRPVNFRGGAVPAKAFVDVSSKGNVETPMEVLFPAGVWPRLSHPVWRPGAGNDKRSLAVHGRIVWQPGRWKIGGQCAARRPANCATAQLGWPNRTGYPRLLHAHHAGTPGQRAGFNASIARTCADSARSAGCARGNRHTKGAPALGRGSGHRRAGGWDHPRPRKEGRLFWGATYFRLQHRALFGEVLLGFSVCLGPA